MNKTASIIFLLLNLIQQISFSQTKSEWDKIDKEVLSQKDKHKQVSLLLAAAEKNLDLHPEQSLRFSNNANKIALSSANQRDIAMSLYYIGASQVRQRNFTDGVNNLVKSKVAFQMANLENDTGYVNVLLKLTIYTEDSASYFAYANKAYKISKLINNASLTAKSLIQLSSGFEKFGNDSINALLSLNSAIDYAKLSAINKTIAEAYGAFGEYYVNENDYPLALENLNRSIYYFKLEGLNSLAATKLKSVSSIHSSVGNKEAAINATIESIKLLEGTAETRRLISAYNDLAEAYIDINNFSQATRYLQLSEGLSISSREDIFLYNTYGLYATMFTKTKQFQNAIEYAKKAIVECEKLDGPGLLMHAQNQLSELYFEVRQYENAIALANKSLESAKNFEKVSNYDISSVKAIIYYNMSRCTFALGDTVKSLEFAQQGWQLIKNSGELIIRYKLSYQLSELYTATDILRKSLEFKNIAMNLLDSINQAEKTKLSSDLLSKYEIEKRDREIALLNKEGQLQSLKIHDRERELFSEKVLSESKEKQLTIVKKEKEIKDVVLRKTEIELKAKSAQNALFAQEKQMNLNKNENQKQFMKLMAVGIILLLISLISIFIAYTQKRKDNQIIALQKKRSDTLLLNILPAETAEELKQNGFAVARQYNDVTVMFTDFKDFSVYAGLLPPSEVVSEVDYCFKAFDAIIGKYNIEKIKTIGDAYMCAAGVPSENKNHATDMIKAAIEIRNFMTQLKEKRKNEGKQFFEMRIGINSGPVVAGIVGLTKFAYDIWGDTVNIASRIEQHSLPGKINISGATYEIVKDQFNCHYRGKVDVKNKGLIDMYFVNV